MKKKYLKDTRSGWWLLISLLMLALCVIWIFPLFVAFFTSFKTHVDVLKFKKNLNLMPLEWTTINYEWVMKNGPTSFWRMSMNSIFVSCSVMVLVVFIDAASAYAYERLDFPFKERIFWTLFGLSMIPGVIGFVSQYYFYHSIGWNDKLISLITPMLGGVFNIFLLRNFMSAIPKEMDEAARIDGANELYIFLKIILPSVKPALMVVALFSFRDAWNDMIWPSLAINNPDKLTLNAGIKLMDSSYGGEYERTLAACMLAMIPTLVVYLVARKYFLQGLQLSAAVKG